MGTRSWAIGFRLRWLLLVVAALSVVVACARGVSPADPVEAALFSDADLLRAFDASGEVSEASPFALGRVFDDGSEAAAELATIATSSRVLAGASGVIVFVQHDTRLSGPWRLLLHDQATDGRILVYQGVSMLGSVSVTADGNTIYFTARAPATDFEIYRLTLTPRRVERLTFTAYDEASVSVSADGRRVAWEGEGFFGQRSVYVRTYAENGSFTQQRLAQPLNQVEPRLSGDGRYLALVQVQVGGRNDVLRFDFDTTTYDVAYRTTRPVVDPSVTDGGRQVAFLLNEPGFHRVLVRDLDTGSLDRVVSNAFGMGAAHMTGDGRHLVFSLSRLGSQDLGGADLFTRDVATGAQARLTSYATPAVQHLAPFWAKLSTPGDPMILTVDTRLGDGTTVTLPLSGAVDVTVDWGDGSTTTVTEPAWVAHDYAAEGAYTVRVAGALAHLGIGPTWTDPYPNVEKLVSVDAWGNLGLGSLEGAFTGAVNVTSVPPDLPPTVLNLDGAFYGATSFNGPIGSWDVSNVTSMVGMFSGAGSFDQGLSDWNVASVTSTSRMFENASSFNRDIGAWDVSSVEDMSFMFAGATAFNQDLSTWCVTAIPAEPLGFAESAASWVLPKPVWGTCPGPAPVVTVAIEPPSWTMEPGDSRAVAAVVAGTSETGVTWSATCGSITGTGNDVSYTAPDVEGTCTVTATSVADPTSSASASVTIAVEVPLALYPASSTCGVDIAVGATCAVVIAVAGPEAAGWRGAEFDVANPAFGLAVGSVQLAAEISPAGCLAANGPVRVAVACSGEFAAGGPLVTVSFVRTAEGPSSFTVSEAALVNPSLEAVGAAGGILEVE